MKDRPPVSLVLHVLTIAGAHGLEPRLGALETSVLPLYDTPYKKKQKNMCTPLVRPTCTDGLTIGELVYVAVYSNRRVV